MNAESAESDPNPLRSVHTSNFPDILTQLQASLLVTTYQAGKLIVLRSEGELLNTHFRDFHKPMGLALAGNKLAIGCGFDIHEFHNAPAICRRLDAHEAYTNSHASHDACFLPRRSHCTGDIQIHEMAWVQDELVFMNTEFSCLAVRSDSCSFRVAWKPHFIQQLAPGDHCHLNGMAVRDERIQFLTALGESSEPGGWRNRKADGGILIDVVADEIVCRGLSMPHSPRWHNDRLWMLESGDGTLGYMDPATGKYESIVQLPGFTRGLSFAGPFAFVGLSQVRESATFSGIPLVARLEKANERHCGVWVIHLETGQVAGFCQFEDGVQEIFAVEVLRGATFPDVVNHDPEIIGQSYLLDDTRLAANDLE